VSELCIDAGDVGGHAVEHPYQPAEPAVAVAAAVTAAAAWDAVRTLRWRGAAAAAGRCPAGLRLGGPVGGARARPGWPAAVHAGGQLEPAAGHGADQRGASDLRRSQRGAPGAGLPPRRRPATSPPQGPLGGRQQAQAGAGRRRQAQTEQIERQQLAARSTGKRGQQVFGRALGRGGGGGCGGRCGTISGAS
jgi:hypothetical protein